MVEDNVGINQSIHITNPLDVWTPAAIGSSSRVFFSMLQNRQNLAKPAAIKIMRPAQREYALPLFAEEIKILKVINDIQGVTRMNEMGFIKFDNEKEFPEVNTPESCVTLTGKALRFNPDENINAEQLEDWVSLGWLPYLALGVKDYHQNLYMLCDLVRAPKHKPLDLNVALDISVKLCEIFLKAHQRNIAYFDHKITHYYWYSNLSQAYVIDWNVGKLYTALADEQKNFDIVQFGARVLHFIFTGRFAPGALALSPTRSDEIQFAPYKYKVDWGYDDKRIPDNVKEVISSALNGEYTDFSQLKTSLKNCQGSKSI
jgi:hypothetical protein